jgi:Dolichyl-phosphate-mannose-protein mannosyltransferase
MELKYPDCEALHLLILGFVCGLVFFVNLGRVPFYDNAEPREAVVVSDIVLNGNWIFPLRFGQQIPSKPPLFHWSGALTSLIWGRTTEATIRFPSALFASLGVFLVYYLGRKLFDPIAGLFAGLILATSTVYQAAAVEARVDMTLTFWLTLSLVLFYAIYRGFLKNPLWKYAFFFAVGVGVLAKGPVSLVLCGLIVAVFLAARKRWDLFWVLALHPGVILAIAVFSIWYGSALSAGGEKFFGVQVIKENFARFFVYGEGGTGHQKPVYYFFPYLFTLGLPWTMLLPVGLVHYFRWHRFRDERELFLGIWIAVIFVFFSLSAGKRPPYILPLYPPLALLTAVWIQSWRAELGRPCGIRVVAWCAALGGAIILLTFLGSLFGHNLSWFLAPIEARLKPGDLQQFQLIRDVIKASGLLFPSFLLLSALFWLLIGTSLFHYRWTAFVAQLAGISALSFVVVQALLMPAVASERSYKGFVESVARTYDSSGTIYVFPKGLDYSSIFFYGGNDLRLLPEDDDALMKKLAASEDYVIMGEREWREVLARWSLSVSPLLRSKGTGPARDNALILVRGVKS